MKWFLMSLIALGVHTNVYAEQAAQQQGNWLSLAPLVLLFVVFYFLLIRPQQKKAKAHKKMTEGLKKDDEVITYGGMLGCVKSVDETFVELEVAKNVNVKIQRSGVSSVMPKGTYQSSSSDSKDTE